MYSKQLVSREELKIQSKENLRRINSVINEDHPFYLPFHIGLHCGVRVGEICGLEWKHINFEEMTLEIEQQLVGIEDEKRKINWQSRPPKSKADYRTIPFGNALTKILRAL
ncbi:MULTISPECIES: tyrosine-type recombinase/integrase [unclassified Lysinibacillus]|uniref:tyrosine-type recombinase/integrase n=1 Tax=unclassified Lysinibacillus TaxID=2636778 RepID=UPI00381272EF